MENGKDIPARKVKLTKCWTFRWPLKHVQGPREHADVTFDLYTNEVWPRLCIFYIQIHKKRNSTFRKINHHVCVRNFQSVWMYMFYLICLWQVSAWECSLFSCTFANKQPAAFFFLIALLLVVPFQAAHADVMHLHVGRTGCVQTFVFVSEDSQ